MKTKNVYICVCSFLYYVHFSITKPVLCTFVLTWQLMSQNMAWSVHYPFSWVILTLSRLFIVYITLCNLPAPLHQNYSLFFLSNWFITMIEAFFMIKNIKRITYNTYWLRFRLHFSFSSFLFFFFLLKSWIRVQLFQLLCECLGSSAIFTIFRY